MMKLRLHQFEHSPFCLAIARALDALGVPFESVEVPPWERSDIIRLTRGAYYQVPVIESEGAVIFESSPDSQDVAHFVDRISGQGRLFPERLEGLQSLLLHHLENHVEAVTFRLSDPGFIRDVPDLVARTLLVRHKERKFGSGCLERWAGEERASLETQAHALLRPYEQILRSSPWLLGPQPVYADFLLYGILGNLTYKGYAGIPQGLTALPVWYNRFRAWRYPEA